MEDFSWTGLGLCVTANLYSNAYYGTLLAEFGLMRDEAAVIVCIGFWENSTAQEIVRLTGRPKNSISRAVRAMETRGAIVRIESPGDQRFSPIMLTDAGRQLYRDIAGVAEEQDRRMLALLDHEERRMLRCLLDRLRQAMPSR